MKNKKIAFDLDGVIYDFIYSLDKYAESIGLSVVNDKSYELFVRYGISKNMGLNLLKEFGETSPFLTIPIIQDGLDEIRKLQIDNEIYIITYRNWTPTGKIDTLKRLKLDCINIPKNNIIFSKNKGDAAKKLDIDIFYEDSFENALDIIKKSDAKIILIDAPYNKIKHKKIRRLKWQKQK